MKAEQLGEQSLIAMVNILDEAWCQLGGRECLSSQDEFKTLWMALHAYGTQKKGSEVRTVF